MVRLDNANAGTAGAIGGVLANADQAGSIPMADGELAGLIAEFAAGLSVSTMPRDVVTATKVNIFDTLACAVAGSSAPGVLDVVELARSWGGAPQATLLAFGDKVPAHHAAWVNGAMSHARDFDDTHDEAVLHAGVTVVPAALAAAELSGAASGADFLAAVAAGLEVVCRLGVATRVGIVESGFMYTPLFGHFGAVVAAGRVLGLSRAQIINAIGISYSQVAGNHQVTRDAALTKRMQPGFAAQAALLSVQLARRNVRGVQNTFDGADGFLRVYLQGRFDRDRMVDALGTRFEFTGLSYKAYPCCRFNHTAIDAALALRASPNVDPRKIRRIVTQTTRQAYEAVCTPLAIRRSPQTVVQAQFSIPYTLSAALIDGFVGLDHFTPEGLKRSDILELAARVDPVVSEEIEAAWGRSISPTRVALEMFDGSEAEIQVDYPKGHPNRPMTTQDFDAKMEQCLGFAAAKLPASTRGQLRDMVDRLEHLEDVGVLAALLTPPGGAGE